MIREPSSVVGEWFEWWSCTSVAFVEEVEENGERMSCSLPPSLRSGEKRRNSRLIALLPLPKGPRPSHPLSLPRYSHIPSNPPS